MTPGQRVEFLLESVLELVLDKSIDISDVEIRFIGIEYLNTQKTNNFSKQLCEIIVTTPRVPRNEAFNYNMNSDYLLSFTEQKNKAIYAKTYDYIACKKDILVIRYNSI